jgi:hypothetical protein
LSTVALTRLWSFHWLLTAGPNHSHPVTEPVQTGMMPR